MGVGARHALFPYYEHLALASVRRSTAVRFPTLISIASGVHGLLAGPSVRLPVRISSEVSSPDPICARMRASFRRSGHQPVKIFRCLPFFRGRLAPFECYVCLGLRVLPLTSQSVFSLQSGDPVFRPPEAGGFVRPCRIGPTPRVEAPLSYPECESGPFGGVDPPAFLHVLVPSNRCGRLGHWVSLHAAKSRLHVV